MKKTVDKPKDEGVKVELTYLGRELGNSPRHCYLLNGEKEIYFRGKLQRHHFVGNTYYAFQFNGTQYKTKAFDPSIKSSVKIDKHMIAERVRRDEMIGKRLKAKSEEKKLEKLARDAAKSIKTVYSRANNGGQLAMIRVFVEELEK